MSALSYLASPLSLIMAKLVSFMAGSPVESEVVGKKAIEKGWKSVQQTVWTGKNGQNFKDPTNWSHGLPEKDKHAYVPTYPKGDHFPVISEDCLIDYTIKNDGMIKNKGVMTISRNGLIQNYGIFENKRTSKIINQGKFINAGTLINTGFIDNQHLFSNGKMIKNSGTFLGQDRIIDMNKLKDLATAEQQDISQVNHILQQTSQIAL